jgi:site-specific recombinase XerD
MTFAQEARLAARPTQKLLGHRDLSTTMIHPHVLNKGGQQRKFQEQFGEALAAEVALP